MQSIIKKRITSKAAFTLAEALVAILIMLMVSGIMVAGIPAAKNAYENVIEASNAEILLSSAVTTLRNQLGTAGSVRVQNADNNGKNGNAVVFYNTNTHTASKISIDATSNELKYQEYSGMTLNDLYGLTGTGAFGEDVTLSALPSTGGNTPSPTGLVPEKAKEPDQYVACDSISITEDGVVSFNNLCVRNSKKDTNIAPRQPLSSLSIRVISSVD